MADIFGTSSNDELTGTADADNIYGFDGDDTLHGDAGEDTLEGGEGNDSLDGGTGADQLRGQGGNDVLLAFGGDSADGGEGNDALTVGDGAGTNYSGGTGSDALTLDFTLAASGVAANLTFLWSLGYNASIGSASVESFESIAGEIRGSAFDDSVTIGAFYASPVAMALGAGGDSGNGGSGADILDGGAGNDHLSGFDGNDTLDGGLGSDTLNGGGGNDELSDADGNASLNGEGGDDIVRLGVVAGGSADGGAGTDHLHFDLAAATAGASISLNAFGGVLSGTLGGISVSGFETLYTAINQTTAYADTITIGSGFAGAVTLWTLGGNDSYSGGSGSDYVDGGAGDDVLGGGAGTDTLIGGTGNDSFEVDTAADMLTEIAGEGTDTVRASISWRLDAEFENLTLIGAGNINGYGNAAGNLITGNGGANRVEAETGDDIVHGGGGGDTLFGMEGNDTLNGDAGNDALDGSSGNNIVNGGAGDDYIVVNGNSADTVDGGEGFDLLDIRPFGATAGFAIDLSGLWLGSNGWFNGAAVTGIEGVVGMTGTSFDDSVVIGTYAVSTFAIDGAGGNDALSGGGGGDELRGGIGNDLLAGLGGANLLLGDAGDDKIETWVTGGDTIDGGTGQDGLRLLTGLGGPMLIDLTALWAGGTGTMNGGTVVGIEYLYDPIIGTPGNDSIAIGAGYAQALTINTGDGDDTLTAGSGNDGLRGFGGSDTLHAGAGADTVEGGADGDHLYGEAGDDVLDGGSLTEPDDNFGDDWLYGGIGNDTLYGRFGADRLYGGDGSDSLYGGNENDLIEGGSGNDILDGAIGTDTMVGGLGNDSFHVDHSSDVVTEAAGEGTDTVFSLFDYTLGANLENLVLAGPAIKGIGNGLANTITGNGAANFLYGGTGADTLIGLLGNDSYFVDDIGDVATEAVGAGNDTVNSSVTFTLGANIERLVLTGAAAINGTGNALANTLTGNGAANVLDGGAGGDVMKGGGGNDVYHVDNSNDRVEEASGGGNDTVHASADFSIAGQNVETLILTGTAIKATGSGLANTLVGNAGANTLIGGGGADTMIGGLGNDIYYVDLVGDVVTENAGEGVDQVRAAISYVLGATLENLTLLGTSAINGTGNASANTILGNTNDNILDGGAGADELKGGAGNDTYKVDNAGDAIIELAGEGTDTVIASVTFALTGYADNLTLAGAAAINGTGNGLANILYGNAAANLLGGGNGDDALHGGAGADTLTGGAGLDHYWFETALGAGNIDTISGFAAVDDSIHLDRTIFTGIAANGALAAGAFRAGTVAADADDRILYDAATGNIRYDPDGTGAAAALVFAKVAAGTALTNVDFFGEP